MGRRGTAFFCLGKSCKLLAAILFQGNSQRRDALKDEVLFHCWSRDVSDFPSSSGQSFWSSRYAFRKVSPLLRRLGWIILNDSNASPWFWGEEHQILKAMKTQASKLGEHQTPGRVGRGFAACWARNGYTYEACSFSVRAKHPREFLSRKNGHFLVAVKLVVSAMCRGIFN